MAEGGHPAWSHRRRTKNSIKASLIGHCYGPSTAQEHDQRRFCLQCSALFCLLKSASMEDTTEIAETITERDTEGTASATPATPRTPIRSIVKVTTSNSSPLPPSVARLWRPAAQRNLRNQWTMLAACKQRWGSYSSSGRSHATSLVNAFLSQRYMPSMELGILKDLPDIGKKACQKLFKQQQIRGSSLLSSYRDMVSVVLDMVNAKRSMRCFLKQSNTALIQFSGSSNGKDDAGDGGGIPVYTFLSVACFEKLADELVEMFELELSLKRLLVLELLSARCDESQPTDMNQSDELYQGEFSHLAMCGLYSEGNHALLPPKLKGWVSDTTSAKCEPELSREILQVYLTTWLAEVNVDSHRVQEIFGIISEEMHVNLE